MHGLYYLLMHGWVAVGTSPAVLRIPSVIAMAVAAALMVILGRRLTGSGWAGLFAGLIMVLTPSISFYAQTARSYAMVFACVLGATLALMHAMEAERPAGRASSAPVAGLRRAGGPGRLPERDVAAGAGGARGHGAAGPVRAADGCSAGLSRRRRERRWLLRWSLLSIQEHAALGWIARPGLTDLRVLFHDYFGADDRGRRCCWSAAPSLALLPAARNMAMAARCRDARPGRGARACLVAERGSLAALGGGAAAGGSRRRS